MKKILLSSAALVMTVGVAAAADMPLKAPLKAPPPVALPWENVYIGAEGGYGFSRQSWDQITSSCVLGPPVLPANCAPPGGPVLLDRVAAGDGAKGGLAGGVIGFNRQINRIVYGVEFSWDWANLNGNQAHVLAPTLSTTTHVDWISTFTGRIGYLATDRTLLYVKGGYAILDENYRINSGGVLATTRPDGTRRAFVVGGGLEFAFGANLSAKAEYNYLGFREHTYEFTRIAGAPLAGLVEGWEGRQQTHIVKVGLNWHFMPGPVIARY